MMEKEREGGGGERGGAGLLFIVGLFEEREIKVSGLLIPWSSPALDIVPPVLSFITTTEAA